LQSVFSTQEAYFARSLVERLAHRYPESDWRLLTDDDLIDNAGLLALLARHREYCKACPGLTGCATDSKKSDTPRHYVARRLELVRRRNGWTIVPYFGRCRALRAGTEEAPDER
jgi:hypothetical protein